MKNYRSIVIIFFVIYLIVGVLIFKDYGLSWDESSVRLIGQVNWDYAVEGNQDLLTFRDRFYGPVFPVFLVAVEKIFNLTDTRMIYLTRHGLTFLIFYLSVIVFYRLCRLRFNSPVLALTGCLLLILHPRIFSHSFFNSKDIVFLSFTIFSIFTLYHYLKNKNLWSIIWHAVICGLLVDVRILGILMPVLTVIVCTLQFIKGKSRINIFLLHTAVFLAVLSGIVILFQPILWQDPIQQFYLSLQSMSHFDWPYKVLYLGKLIKASDLPWHYAPVWILITTPIFFLILFLFGIIKLIFKFSSRRFDVSEDCIIDLTVLFLTILPVVSVILMHSTLYDGWRHLYFIYPSIVWIAVIGLKSIWDFIDVNKNERDRKIYQKLVISMTIIFLCLIGMEIAWLHPFQHLYFNRFAGKNMQEVKRRFDLDYWGLTYFKALEFIADNDHRERIIIFAENYPGELNIQLLPEKDRRRINITDQFNKADYFINNFRTQNRGAGIYPEIYSIKLAGEPICAVYQVKSQ